jgi:hypothetical protein
MSVLNQIMPNPPDYYGYSCNVWLAKQLTQQLFPPDTKHVWFSTHFNPAQNVPSSNPAEIYISASRAVQEGDIGSRIIRDYRLQLIRLVEQLGVANQLTYQQVDDYRTLITNEGIASFRPEVWRLDLQKIATRQYGTADIPRLKRDCRMLANNQVAKVVLQVLQPDEYLIEDLKDDEYEEIIIG